VTCDLIVLPTDDGSTIHPATHGSGKGGGFSPQDLQAAYNVASEKGEGLTIAVVVPFKHPDAESDLSVYRSHYGLPPCTTANGCFKKLEVNPTGGGQSSWAKETSLDLDMVSATCPKCNILLVESGPFNNEGLSKGVQAAANFGADVISLSSESNESSSHIAYNKYYENPGVPTFVAAGNSANVSYPAAAPAAIAVGGTSLQTDESPRGWRETAWKGAGSGCSKYQLKPAWQDDAGCDHRAVSDVAAVASPFTPVSAYSSEKVEGVGGPGWFNAGGTSAAAPIVAGIMATKSQSFREGAAQSFYEAANGHQLYDVIGGGNFNCVENPFQGRYLCEGLAGYDGPTGVGTPGTALPGPPASTLVPTLLEPEEATLNGIVHPQGAATTYVFEYGLTTEYGSSAPATPADAGEGITQVPVSQKITGLKPETEYHFRLSATNSTGTFKSADRTFTTLAQPQLAVATEPASAVQQKSATLHGAINPAGSNASYQFEYGRTESYGNTAPAQPSETGASFTTVNQGISGLKSGSTYHFRLKATQGETSKYGWDRTLKTPPGPPTVGIAPATGIGGFFVTLNGLVHSGGEETDWFFEAVPQAVFEETGFANAEIVVPGPGDPKVTALPVDAEVNDFTSLHGALRPATGFRFRVVATNAKGTAISEDETFTTPEWGITTEAGGADGGRRLHAVSCVSSSDCVAVGYARKSISEPKETMAWRGSTNAGKWDTSVPTPEPENAEGGSLEDVSCVSADDCTAVGYYVDGAGVVKPLAMGWDGEDWTLQSPQTPTGAGDTSLEGVSCPSSEACVAVGSYVNGSGTKVTLVERREGGEWTVQSSPNPGGAKAASLYDVSCATASDCRAVGESEDSGGSPSSLAIHGSESEWTLDSMSQPTDRLTSVSCPSTSWCAAVGDGLYVETWNGSAWSRQQAPAPGGSAALNGVSCASSTDCAAVGEYSNEGTAPFAEHWDGEEWSTNSVEDPLEGPSEEVGSLKGVSCAPSPRCAAVGFYDRLGGYNDAGIVQVRLLNKAITMPAASVGTTAAELRGIVDPGGVDTSYYFEYDTKEYAPFSFPHGTKVPTEPKSIGSGSEDVAISEPLEGLESGLTYHYRVVAVNSVGESVYGAGKSFETLHPPRFEAEQYPATISGDQDSEDKHLFTLLPGDTIDCEAATLSGEAEAHAPTLTLDPGYSECTAHRPVGNFAATIKPNGCDYVLDAEEAIWGGEYVGSLDIACPEEKAIEITISTCKYEIPAQSGLATVKFKDDAEASPQRFTADLDLTGIEYTYTDALFCPFEGSGTNQDGKLTGATIFTGENEAEAPTGVRVDGA
jgi:hypothetical protein